MKADRSAKGSQRYCCQSEHCPTKTFMECRYRAYQLGIKEQQVSSH